MRSRATRGCVASCAALLLAAAMATGCGSDSSSGGSASAAAVSSTGSTAAPAGGGVCGTKPVTVGFAKGAGDTWTKIALATLKDEAAKCPNIKKVLFTDARGNQTKGIADINGLVAQGVNVLIVMPEFGPAELPALRAASRAGVTVITQIDALGAKIPQDIAGDVNPDMDAVGKRWADWLEKAAPGGKLVFLGGIPGAQSSKTLFDALKKALAAHPDLKLVVDHVVDTNWNAGQRQRVMAGLLAKYGRIDGVVSDYGTIDYGTLNAYKQAHLKLPALAAFASSNGISCYWAKNGKFPFLSIDGQTTVIRHSLRKGLAIFNKTKDPEPGTVELIDGIDTAGGKQPTCDSSLPDDAALGSDLSAAQLRSIFH
jgi:ribose transport system substrate-binding protein